MNDDVLLSLPPVKSYKSPFLPPEWWEQDAIQLTWPHERSDWKCILSEAKRTFLRIAEEISLRQHLIVVVPSAAMFFEENRGTNLHWDNVIVVEALSNDTWARDHGGITRYYNGKIEVLDFQFNGWGNKYDHHLDNAITEALFEADIFQGKVARINMNQFVLEGGAIEVNGKGLMLSTTSCLWNKSRNPELSKEEIERELKQVLGVSDILWLGHGHLEGDDTDGHIDTLARFCNEDTIAYVQCKDENDTHFKQLFMMEEELKEMANRYNLELVPLPMVPPIFDDERRLPVTYANFLIINGAVLVPTYNVATDLTAKRVLMKLFPDREVVLIDCSTLVKQNGSLHCITMQYPRGVLKK